MENHFYHIKGPPLNVTIVIMHVRYLRNGCYANDLPTILPAKSDSDVMFVYKVIRDLWSIDHMCINPIRRIGLIHKWSIDSH